VASPSGHGVHGQATGTGGNGVWGLADNINGNGVKGDSQSGIGVLGNSTSGYGVAGRSNGVAGDFRGGTAVQAITTVAGGNGVYADSQNGVAVLAKSEFQKAIDAFSTNNNAIVALSVVNDAIVGRTGQGGKSSVFGYTDAQNANGGYFNSANAAGGGHGVVGQSSSATGNGVYSIGRFAATGTKSFQIDHPFDPENKYLVHYCTEGPEPMNTYSGSIVTDTKGKAWVDLPAYFSEINKEPRVQLTVDDDTDDIVIAKVAGGVQADGFRIRTNKPGVKVYWEVKAVRNDRFVRQNGAPVEPEKPDSERGTYLHPELYGVNRERGLFYRAAPESSAQSRSSQNKRTK
jgi:hypothetical protein